MKTAMILALLVLAACAAPPEPRQLTVEQDAEVAAKCAAGCAIVPAPVWQQIMKRLQGVGV